MPGNEEDAQHQSALSVESQRNATPAEEAGFLLNHQPYRISDV